MHNPRHEPMGILCNKQNIKDLMINQKHIQNPTNQSILDFHCIKELDLFICLQVSCDVGCTTMVVHCSVTLLATIIDLNKKFVLFYSSLIQTIFKI